MNEKFLFFDTSTACNKTLYTYVENILGGRKMDQKFSE